MTLGLAVTLQMRNKSMDYVRINELITWTSLQLKVSALWKTLSRD